ncbi:HutD family protein [Streptomyces sp. NPDC046821]|uniref:HutD/Ves family protein n=1 Tax=Streptomyces sp. NPDC046821 TaxID=3154702 RepID=UPI0033ECD505
MTVRPLPAADRLAVAWKNGGGTTREIVAEPPGADMADFLWRVSLADVGGDGPFSAFPGVDRTLTMVEGAGMDLVVGGEDRKVDERYVPQDFRGDVPTDCRLIDGPVVNFNVMWRRDAPGTPPRVAVVRGRLTLTGEALVVALEDEGADVDGFTLGRYDAVRVSGEAAVLHARGRTAVVTFG